MEKINYLEILKKAWKITWENKYLWWFGFFLSFGTGSFWFKTPPKKEFFSGSSENIREIGMFFEKFILNHTEEEVILGITIAFLVCLLFLILANISRGGVIKSIHLAEQGKPNNLKNGFRYGKKYFWKIFGISFFLNALVLILITVILVPIGFLFYLKSYWMGAVAVFFGVIIIFPLAAIKFFIQEYAYIYAVLSDLKIKFAIENAYRLFRKNLLAGLIMALLLLPINLALIFIFFAAVIVVGIAVALISIFSYLIFGNLGAVVGLSVGIIVLVGIFIFLCSVYKVFLQTAWVMFFMEIASSKKEDLAEAKEGNVEIVSEKIPTTGEVV